MFVASFNLRRLIMCACVLRWNDIIRAIQVGMGLIGLSGHASRSGRRSGQPAIGGGVFDSSFSGLFPVRPLSHSGAGIFRETWGSFKGCIATRLGPNEENRTFQVLPYKARPCLPFLVPLPQFRCGSRCSFVSDKPYHSYTNGRIAPNHLTSNPLQR